MNRKNWLPVSDVDLGGNEREYLLQAFDSGQISGSGSFCEKFEMEFADYCGTQYALSCANGTVAIHLALLALGVKPGDEIIVPSLTYVATTNAVTYCGATPVFADCDASTWNISAGTISPLITKRTRGIIVVPLYGNPVDYEPIQQLTERHGLFIVEDAAEAHGAEYRGKRCGTFGDIATFSFYGNKLITTGEGGMVISDDEDLVNRARLFRGQGMDPDRRYWFPVIGYNYRLTNLQCAIGLAQLERLAEFIETRRRLAQIYTKEFSRYTELTLQNEQPGGKSSWWMFSIRVPDHEQREKLIEALADNGIETRPVFLPMHILPPYRNSATKCPVAEKISLTGLNLPSGGHVTEEDVHRIVDIVAREIT